MRKGREGIHGGHKHSTQSTAAAAAKSLQSCLNLCDPIDGSPPGSPVPGILQARTLECVAISFSKEKLSKDIFGICVFHCMWKYAYINKSVNIYRILIKDMHVKYVAGSI